MSVFDKYWHCEGSDVPFCSKSGDVTGLRLVYLSILHISTLDLIFSMNPIILYLYDYSSNLVEGKEMYCIYVYLLVN